MSKLCIAVLFGGCSTEYGVSLQSAHALLSHIDKGKYDVLPVGIDRAGRWFYYFGFIDAILDGTWCDDLDNCIPCAISPNRGAPELILFGDEVERVPFDAAFPVLHGKNGEDGTVQGLIELAGIPLIGCDTLSSALCMDKDRAHKLAALAGVRVPQSMAFERGAAMKELYAAADTLGYPLFVKPVRAGSSFGITKVLGSGDLEAAVQAAFRHDSEILLEEAIEGFEVGCAVLGNQELMTGAVDEIELSEGFFDFEEKYTLKTSKIHCPARISPEQARQVQETAKRIYRALHCRVFARVDLFLTPQGELVFNEVNTIPGFTAHSRYPNMMQAAGLGFGELVERLIALGLETP